MVPRDLPRIPPWTLLLDLLDHWVHLHRELRPAEHPCTPYSTQTWMGQVLQVPVPTGVICRPIYIYMCRLRYPPYGTFDQMGRPLYLYIIFIRCHFNALRCVSPTRGGVSLTRDKHPLWVSRRGGVRVFLEVRPRRGVRGLHSCIQVYMLCAYGCPMRRLDVGMIPITLLNEGVTWGHPIERRGGTHCTM